VGIFSERDLLMKVAGQFSSYDAITVRDVMTPKPDSVTAEDTLAFAVHKMDVGGYRHVPVVDNGRPTGVLSARDLLRHIVRLCKESSHRSTLSSLHGTLPLNTRTCSDRTN